MEADCQLTNGSTNCEPADYTAAILATPEPPQRGKGNHMKALWADPEYRARATKAMRDGWKARRRQQARVAIPETNAITELDKAIAHHRDCLTTLLNAKALLKK